MRQACWRLCNSLADRWRTSLLKSMLQESDLGIVFFVSRFLLFIPAKNGLRLCWTESLRNFCMCAVDSCPILLARHVLWASWQTLSIPDILSVFIIRCCTGPAFHLRVWASVPITVSLLFTVRCDISPPGNWQPGCYCEMALPVRREKGDNLLSCVLCWEGERCPVSWESALASSTRAVSSEWSGLMVAFQQLLLCLWHDDMIGVSLGFKRGSWKNLIDRCFPVEMTQFFSSTCKIY